MARKHGLCSGWTDFRYGGEKRPITLAGSKPRRIIRGHKREHVVDSVAVLLKAFKLSPFEHEAACLHGLRSGFCLEGHRWPLANLEAEQIVAEALRQIGAERPTWGQGQREYTVPRENCSWCRRPLKEEDYTGKRDRKFCSAKCARSALRYRDVEDRRSCGTVVWSARRLVYAEKRPLKVCKNCGGTFRPTESKAIFCSTKCSSDHQRCNHDISCKTCGKKFRPTARQRAHCSEKCYYDSRIVRQIACTCQLCGTEFISKLAGTLYCGK